MVIWNAEKAGQGDSAVHKDLFCLLFKELYNQSSIYCLFLILNLTSGYQKEVVINRQ